MFELGQGSIGTVNAAQTGYFCSNTGTDNFALQLTDPTGRTLFIDCIVGADNQLRCLATRSQP